MLLDCGATSDFMWMHTAKRARLPLYKFTHQEHFMTAGGVRVKIPYYTIACVQIREFVFCAHFKVLQILPDDVFWLPWL